VKSLLRSVGPWIGFLLVTVAMYPGVWRGEANFSTNDIVDLNLPQRQIAGEIWRSGEVPLWNRYAFGGQPLLATGEVGVLYPPNLLFLFMRPQTALNLSTLLHLALAGAFMFLFLRRQGRRVSAAWLGGVIYMTSGFLTGHVIHTAMLAAAAWLPLLLFFLEGLRQSKRLREAVGLALTMTVLMLAGHPQMVYYAGLLAVAYAVFLASLRREGRRQFLVAAGGALLLAGLLAACQLLPTLGLAQRSFRHALTLEFFSALPLTGDWLRTLVVPFRIGGIPGYPGPWAAWERNGYAGIVALLLALTAAFRFGRRERHVAFFAGMGVLALLIAAGDLTHASALLYHIPLANQFRIPARYVLFFDLAAAVLAARALCGAGEMIEVRTRTDVKARARRNRNAGARAPISPVWLASGGVLLLMVLLDALQHPARLPLSIWGTTGLYLVGALGILWICRSHPHRVAALLGVLILLDNTGFVRAFNGPVLQPASAARGGGAGTPEWIAQMQRDPERHRFFSFEESLKTNRATPYHLEALNGYGPLYPTLYAESMSLTRDPNGTYPPTDIWTPLVASREVFDLLNVRYIAACYEVGLGREPARPHSTTLAMAAKEPVQRLRVRYQATDREPVFEFAESGPALAPLAEVTAVSADGRRETHPLAEEIHLSAPMRLKELRIEDTEWRGSLQIAEVRCLAADGRCVAARGPLPALGHPLQEIFRDNRFALFRNSAAYPRYWLTSTPEDPRNRDMEAPIQETAYRHREYDVCASSGGGWLVVSQLYDPGWVAYLDGARTPVREIGFYLTGLRLPAGRHNIRFRYEPREWTCGLGLSALAALALTAWIACAARSRVW
jgi:Bacterial membrane protein YfhO